MTHGPSKVVRAWCAVSLLIVAASGCASDSSDDAGTNSEAIGELANAAKAAIDATFLGATTGKACPLLPVFAAVFPAPTYEAPGPDSGETGINSEITGGADITCSGRGAAVTVGTRIGTTFDDELDKAAIRTEDGQYGKVWILPPSVDEDSRSLDTVVQRIDGTPVWVSFDVTTGKVQDELIELSNTVVPLALSSVAGYSPG